MSKTYKCVFCGADTMWDTPTGSVCYPCWVIKDRVQRLVAEGKADVIEKILKFVKEN